MIICLCPQEESRKGRPIFAGQVRQNAAGQSQESSSGSSSQQQARPGAPEETKKPHHAPPRVDYREYKEKKAREAAAAAAALAAASAAGGVSKDSKPPPSQPVRPPLQPHPAKRDLAKREMLARENAKREAMKVQQQRPVDVPNQHHSSQDQKRPSESAIASSSHSADLAKRPENHHLSTDPSRRSSDLATSIHHHHHHHPDQSRRDKERPETSSNHHPSMNQLKRPREGAEVVPSPHQISQAKRAREGADPMMNTLDPTKRPREPTDSSSIFSSLKSETNIQSSSSSESKHLGSMSKYPSDIKSQPPGSHSTFGDRPNKSLPPASTSASQRHFSHSKHSRPQEGGGKSFEHEQQRKLAMEKRESSIFPKPQQDSHSLRPNQPVPRKSPVPTPFSRSKSPLETSRLSETRPRSPLMPDKLSTTPEVSKRMADILSRPEGHLFSPDDDREDSSLNLDASLPDLTKFDTKPPKPSSSMKSKLRSTPEKSRESLLAPPTFVLPSSPTSPATPGKSALPTTPSSDRKRKRTQSSSSSEAELVPVVRKLEDMPGFHTLIKDGGMGIKLPGRVSDHSLPSTPGKDNPSPVNIKHDLLDTKLPVMTELAKVESRHSFASLAAESRALENLTKSEEVVQPVPSIFEPLPAPSVEPPREEAPPEHHRKKKKEKHGKKDKDKDRNREEKKHKHKKKDREKAREEKNAAEQSAPIKLTIHKDKVTNFSQDNKSSPLSQDTTLKIKIPKERLKVESPPVASSSTSTASSVALGGLKIKIGKEVISERRLESSPSEHTSRKQRANESARVQNPGQSRRNYNKQNGHQDRKVRGGYTRGRGRAPPMHQPPPPLPPPPYPHQYYPYPPPPPPMYMYPSEAQHMYGYYPSQPNMYQQYPPPPLSLHFQNPPPPPLPDGPPPIAPPPPPPPE